MAQKSMAKKIATSAVKIKVPSMKDNSVPMVPSAKDLTNQMQSGFNARMGKISPGKTTKVK